MVHIPLSPYHFISLIHIMNKMLKKTVAGLMGIIGLAWIVYFAPASHAQQYTTVTLTISWGTVTIGSTWSFDFWSFTVQATPQNVDKQFTGSSQAFFVEDLAGVNSGYYSTLSVTALTGTNGSIAAANVYAKVDTLATTLITGTSNTWVVVANGLTGYTSLATPVTFIKRDAGSNLGRTGKYGTRPWLRVVVPAYQAVGNYQGTLTYTLYLN